jgi:hypothetical protein
MVDIGRYSVLNYERRFIIFSQFKNFLYRPFFVVPEKFLNVDMPSFENKRFTLKCTNDICRNRDFEKADLSFWKLCRLFNLKEYLLKFLPQGCTSYFAKDVILSQKRVLYVLLHLFTASYFLFSANQKTFSSSYVDDLMHTLPKWIYLSQKKVL